MCVRRNGVGRVTPSAHVKAAAFKMSHHDANNRQPLPQSTKTQAAACFLPHFSLWGVLTRKSDQRLCKTSTNQNSDRHCQHCFYSSVNKTQWFQTIFRRPRGRADKAMTLKWKRNKRQIGWPHYFLFFFQRAKAGWDEHQRGDATTITHADSRRSSLMFLATLQHSSSFYKQRKKPNRKKKTGILSLGGKQKPDQSDQFPVEQIQTTSRFSAFGAKG